MHDTQISYQLWMRQNEPGSEALEAQRKERLSGEPKISVILPVSGQAAEHISKTIDSVLGQTYSNWELCAAVEEESPIKELLEGYSRKDGRVKTVVFNGMSLAKTLNGLIGFSTGGFKAFLCCGDVLSPFALYEVAKAVNGNPGVELVYSDEDSITDDLTRFSPRFKPDFSPDFLRSYNYISNLLVVEKSLIDNIGLFRDGYDGAESYDLTLRATEKASKIVHIPKVLYHSRMKKEDKTCCEVERKALSSHLERIGQEGRVEYGICPGSYKVTYTIKNKPKVSIIIPNRDHPADLRRCVGGVLEKSTYKNFDVIIIENGSVLDDTFKLYGELKDSGPVKVLEWKKPFNYSAINNYGAASASGETLLFLNNDIEVISPDWIERMLEHAARREVGIVGAKQYYPFETIQHAGIVLGEKVISRHAHRCFPREASGYSGRLSVIQNFSAVSGSCVMLRREAFEAVGGFGEEYALIYNDIDLCLKLREKGLLVVFTPFAELYHHESKTRGSTESPEWVELCKKEEALFKEKWRIVLEKGDPYYNANLTNHYEDFTVRGGEKEALLESREIEITALEIEITALKASLSWKMTEPLRKIQDIFCKVLEVKSTK